MTVIKKSGYWREEVEQADIEPVLAHYGAFCRLHNIGSISAIKEPQTIQQLAEALSRDIDNPELNALLALDAVDVEALRALVIKLA